MGREFESHHRLMEKPTLGKIDLEEVKDEKLKEEEVPVMSRSRLRNSLVEQSRRNIILAVVGIIGILVLVFLFGVPLLINLSLLFEKSGGTSSQSTNTNAYIATPVINPMPTATNSAQIQISGSAEKDMIVMLYVNDIKEKEADVDEDGNFTFDNVKIDEGENTIKTKAKDNKKNVSIYSPEIKISYLNKPPTLSVDEPTDGKSFGKDDSPIQVKGKTDPKVKITVNDFWAIVDGSGNFSYTLPLQGGENRIKVVATDEAGNKTEKEIKVSYSQ